MLRRTSFLLLRLLLLPRLVRETLQRRRATIVHYHGVSPEILDRDLGALSRRYNFVSLREYTAARASGDGGRLPPKTMVLAFDDGRIETLDLLPVLAKHRIRAVMFVCTGLVGTNRHYWFRDEAARGEVARLESVEDSERLLRLRAKGFDEEREYASRQALSWEEIESMRDWVEFQPHTVFHPVLPRCDADRVRREIARSKADLEARGHPVYAFAYPHGAYGEREVDAVREAGFSCALTGDPGFNSEETDRFRLKRICLNDVGGLSENLVKASGVWGAIRWLLGRDRPPRPGRSRVRWFESPAPSSRRRGPVRDRGATGAPLEPERGSPGEEEEAWTP